jgi:hypothetical protein
MSKKHDFLRSQQNRDKHPDSEMVGSAASVEEEQRRATVQNVSEQDRQEPNRGKVGNDHNKMGETHATQTHEGRRTPESRHDRETQVGTMNVVQARTGGKGAGRGPRGGSVGGKPT